MMESTIAWMVVMKITAVSYCTFICVCTDIFLGVFEVGEDIHVL